MAKKGLLGLVLGAPENDNAEGEDKPLDAKARALQDMYAAMKSGDWKAAAMAFKDAYDACAMAHDEDEGESETEY